MIEDKKKKVWTKDKRGNLRTGLKEAWGGEGVSDLRVAKREEEELRDFKKKKRVGGWGGEMHHGVVQVAVAMSWKLPRVCRW